MKPRILILNPLPGGSKFTTTDTAERYVETRKARWNDPVKKTAIWFKATPEVIYQIHSRQEAIQAAERVWRKRQSGHYGPKVMQRIPQPATVWKGTDTEIAGEPLEKLEQ